MKLQYMEYIQFVTATHIRREVSTYRESLNGVIDVIHLRFSLVVMVFLDKHVSVY